MEIANDRIKCNLALQEKLSAEYRQFFDTLITSPDENNGQQHLYKLAQFHPGFVHADHFIEEIKRVQKARELQRAELHARIKACLNYGRNHLFNLLPQHLRFLADR